LIEEIEMRKMATIRKIDDIRPIEGADAIECAVVGGWQVVVKKGEYNVGDLAVYLEIDSFVPHELAPFLSKGQEPREFNGVKGERLRTVKLRGVTSQGLLLPLKRVE
jgi:RNA ligase (TIGR02306 family)